MTDSAPQSDERSDKAELKQLLESILTSIDYASAEQHRRLLRALRKWQKGEQRKHPRKVCFISVTLGASRESTAFVRDISADGMFIETTSPFSIGEHINLTLLIPYQGEPVEITAEIVRKTPGGIGVRFTSPPRKDLQALFGTP